MKTTKEDLNKYLASHDIFKQFQLLLKPEVTIYLSTQQIDIIKEYIEFPESMEDHWIIFSLNNRTYFIRSWTHLIAFVLEYTTCNHKGCITNIQRGTAFNTSLKNATFKQTAIELINELLPKELKYGRSKLANGNLHPTGDL